MFADETDATLALKSMSAEFAYKIQFGLVTINSIEIIDHYDLSRYPAYEIHEWKKEENQYKK